MKLISCDNCATILDQDKLHFAKDIYNWDGKNETIDDTLAEYNTLTGFYQAFVHCPVCKEKVFEQ